MGENSKIQWCHHTFNPWWGCTRVSRACLNCYAEAFAKRTGVGWGPQAERRLFGEKHWNEPLKWNRAAEKAGERKRVFCASMADVFESRPELDAERRKLWSLIAATPQLDWLLLTKRPENITGMVRHEWLDRWPANVWPGTTAEDRACWATRTAALNEVPAQIRFVSAEPLQEDLGTVDLSGISWLIVGGESGGASKVTPFDPDWVRSLRDQCAATGTAFFTKQMGRWIAGNHRGFGVVQSWRFADGSWRVPPLIGPQARVRPEGATAFGLTDGHGGDWTDWPEDLRIREFPEAPRG